VNRYRRNLALGLIAAVIAVNSVVYLNAASELEAFTRDISRIATVGAAAVMSWIIVGRQGMGGLFGKSYLALALGFGLWLAAETTWGYYELVLQIENPFPSPADILWLAGYGPFGYYMFSLSRFYARGVGTVKTVLVSIVASLFCILYIQNVIGVSELPSADMFIPVAIGMAYPVLDALILVPAVLAIINSGKGMLTSIPWIFMFWVFTVVADSLLGYAIVQNFEADLFLINLFYTTAYLCALAGMYWHNRFMIFNKKQAARHYLK
jgi:hypothetical protein